MNVSITLVREALKKLAKDGLIKIIPNKGVVTYKFIIQDFYEIYDIRLQFESLVIELLIKFCYELDGHLFILGGYNLI